MSLWFVICSRPLHMLQFSCPQILKPIIHIRVTSYKGRDYHFNGQLWYENHILPCPYYIENTVKRSTVKMICVSSVETVLRCLLVPTSFVCMTSFLTFQNHIFEFLNSLGEPSHRTQQWGDILYFDSCWHFYGLSLRALGNSSPTLALTKHPGLDWGACGTGIAAQSCRPLQGACRWWTAHQFAMCSRESAQAGLAFHGWWTKT